MTLEVRNVLPLPAGRKSLAREYSSGSSGESTHDFQIAKERLMHLYLATPDNYYDSRAIHKFLGCGLPSPNYDLIHREPLKPNQESLNAPVFCHL